MPVRRAPPLPVLLLALTLPVLAMSQTGQGYYFQEAPERVFMGFRHMYDDHYQYAAFMRQAQNGGGLLMRNPFASEPQAGVFVLPFLWAVGKLAGVVGGGLILWWELSRLLGGVLYVLTFWQLTRSFFCRRP